MKTPRPEHGSFLCPPQPSLRFHHLSISLDGFICACYLGSYWISLCLHLVSVSVTVPERLLAEFTLCIYFSPSSSSLHALHPKSVLTQAGHIRVRYLLLCCLLLSHPQPGPFLPNCS